MASRCQKCGQQVPRNPPFTAVRISEGEMKSYHDFIGGCIRLERMAKKDEIMQQEIRPLVAVDIIEQLHRQFAILSGGRGKDGAPIITFPEFAGFSDIPDEDFLNVVTYLTSIPSLEAASIGFIIIIDRRRDKWSAVKASLTRIAGAFPGNLQLVFVLRPSRFIQRTIADIGIKLYRDDFKMKVPIIMLNSISDLHGYIDKSQLTRELGGTLEYGHSQWIHHRTAIENFAMTVKTTAQMLQTFGTDLAETELPNDVHCTEDLLSAHTDHHSKLKDELKLAVKQGATLLTCIREPVTRSANSKLSPDELENVATVERLLAQLDETEKAFDQFWTKHHLKLEQCLQLRHFEHDFREVKLTLDNLMEAQEHFADIGDSVTRVEHLLKEQKQLEEKGQEPLEKAQSLALHGDQLIQNNHYAVDSIRPKCVELRRICDDFTNETKKKYDILGKSLELHKQLDKASQWCEAGIYLLASQAVDKCQSQEGAETALVEIEKFLVTAKEHQLSNPKEFYNQFDTILTPEIKANAQRILQKLDDVQEMFDKRQVSLKKLAAKQTRPVQPVAPHPESSPKRASPKTTRPAGVATNRRSTEISCPPKTISEVELSKKKNIKKTKGGIKIEVMHEASQGGSSRVLVMSESDENLSTRRSHIINELIETERVYVEELQSIIEGYASEMDNPSLVHLIPSALQNKKEILFGNLPEIYEFHNRIFLKEIENCIENPELLARCFLKRKEDLQIYEKYCQNKPRSEALWRQCGDSIFFQECQRKLDHKLSLDAYLLKPVQRITKYQLLLKEMLKCSKNSEGTAELEEALATVLDIIKSVNDSMHHVAITGYEGDVSELGKLLMQGSFNVWTDHKKGHNKVKDLARFKPMQRHLFLYTKMLLFCKKREENTDGHEKTASYSFKNSLKMSTVGITENVKGDNKKFEIWYNGREEVYIIQASSVELKNTWISEIRKVLTGQLEACREASQLHQRITESVYHAPMESSNTSRYSRKSSSIYENKSETSNVEASNNKNRNSSPSARQKRVPQVPAVTAASSAPRRLVLLPQGRPGSHFPGGPRAAPPQPAGSARPTAASTRAAVRQLQPRLRRGWTGLSKLMLPPALTLSAQRLLESDSHCKVFPTAELHPKAGYEGVENVVYKHLGDVAKEVLMSGGEALPPCAPSVQRPQGSQTRSDTKNPESKDREVTRRFSLASSISTTVNASAVTKGPLVPAVKVKRHEIKSDPTPLGFEDAFENTILAQTKCNTGSTTRPVPRSASQTGWPSRQMPSLDTFEDFEAIPSSTDELSNSSDLEEETNPNNGTNLFRVEGSFDSCFPDSLTLEDGDLVQFVQEGENGQWLVKKLVSEKSEWVPSSILQPAEGDSNNIIKNSNADTYNDSCSTASVESDTKESEVAKSFPAEQRAGS